MREGDGVAIRRRLYRETIDGTRLAVSELLRRLPAETGSLIGGRVCAPVALRRHHDRPYAAQMTRTLRRIAPHLADDTFLARWYVNAGRTMGELPALHRLASPSKSRVLGLENIAAAKATGRPVIMTAVHVGNWEVVPLVGSRQIWAHCIGPWQPQSNRWDNRLIAQARRRSGYKALPPSPNLVRTLSRYLAVPGQSLIFFIDEISEGTVKFPLFGRPAPVRCNLSFALKLAVRRGALVVPVTARRLGGTQHELVVHPPVDITTLGGDPVEAGAVRLNELYEPFVRANLDQWYMLNRLTLEGQP
nr:lysophospholipid acyltransferase family protein [Acuticoccus mangrovi]